MTKSHWKELSVDDHPHVRHYIAALSNARKAAELVPFPYAVGTRVELVTPTGTTVPARVVRCDGEDGWLDIEISTKDTLFPPVIRYHACHWPEEITSDGMLVIGTAFRVGVPGDPA